MEKLEFIFIIIEAICIIIEIGLEIYSIIENKKSQKILIKEIRKNGRI